MLQGLSSGTTGRMNVSGGSAAAGGMNLHARVAAVAAVHMLAHQQIRWLKDLDADTPCEILFETGGPGDDLQFVIEHGLVVEAQVKKGLTRGDDLWRALELLARGIGQDSIDYGVLVVDQDASGTIRSGLARGIVRLSEGRTDSLDDITTDLKQRLEAAGLSVQEICRRLRIVVVHCSDADNATELLARSLLRSVCATAEDADNAWSALESSAHGMIERRGRWTAEALGGILRSSGVQVRTELGGWLPTLLSGWVWEQLDDLSPQRGWIQRFRQHYLHSDHRAATVFGGRDAECERLDAWLCDAAAPSRMLLCAPTARGKSALLVQWTERLASDTTWAVVFVPISLRFGTDRPSVFYGLLAAQLARLLQVSLTLPPSELDAYYQAMSSSLLGQAASEGRHVLVVVDGLDEAEGAGFIATVFPSSLPTSVKILVSAREQAGDRGEQGWLRRLGWQGGAKAATEKLATLDRDAVAPILESAGLAKEAVTGALVDRLMTLSGGEPLLLALYAEDLSALVQSGRAIGLDALEGFVPGFSAYFAQTFDVQRNPSGAEDQEVVDVTLAVLAMALGPIEGPLLLDLVCSITGKTRPMSADRLVRPIARFVAGDGRPDHGYILNHPKLGEYLREERFDSDGRQRVEEAFRHWGRAIAKRVGADPNSRVPVYAIRYYVSHLCQEVPVALDDVEDLLSGGWRQGWFQLDRDYVGYADSLLDATAAMQSIASYGEDAPRALRLKIKIALWIGSVKSQTLTIPSELLAMALQEQLMTLQQALNVIEFQSPENKRSYLFSIIENLSATAISSLLSQTLEVEDIDSRHDELARLIPYLPESIRAVYIDQLLVWLAASERPRGSAIASLAPILNDVQLETVVARVTSASFNEEDSFSTITILAPVLDTLRARGMIQLEEDLADTFLHWVESATKPLLVVDALAVLADRVPADRLSRQIDRLMLLHQATQPAVVPSQIPAWLDESEFRLALFVRTSVIFKILRMRSFDAARYKAELIAALAPFLVPNYWSIDSLAKIVSRVRDDVRQEIVDIVFQLSLGLPSANNRTYALMQLARSALPPLRRSIVEKALIDARRVEDNYSSSLTLVELFSKLAAADRDHELGSLLVDIEKTRYVLHIGELLVKLSDMVTGGEELADQGFQLILQAQNDANSTSTLLREIGRASSGKRRAMFLECWRRLCMQPNFANVMLLGVSARHVPEYWTTEVLAQVRRWLVDFDSYVRIRVLIELCAVADRLGAADLKSEAIQAIETEGDPNISLSYIVRLLEVLPSNEVCRNLLHRKWLLAADSEKPRVSTLIDGFEAMDRREQAAVWQQLVTCALTASDCVALARLALIAEDIETRQRLVTASFSSLEAASGDQRIPQAAQLVSMLPKGELRWKALDLMTSKPSVSRSTFLSAVRVSATVLAEIGPISLAREVMEDIRQGAAWWP